jgi:hypothetical protein
MGDRSGNDGARSAAERERSLMSNNAAQPPRVPGDLPLLDKVATLMVALLGRAGSVRRPLRAFRQGI